jgi:hypothetical protein
MPGRERREQQMLWSGVLCEKKASRKVYPIFCAQIKKVKGTRGTRSEEKILYYNDFCYSTPTFNIVISFATI